MVSIPACHAGDPGSIPGLGVFFFAFFFLADPWRGGARGDEGYTKCTAAYTKASSLHVSTAKK